MYRQFCLLTFALLITVSAYSQNCTSDTLRIDTTAGPHPFTSL